VAKWRGWNGKTLNKQHWFDSKNDEKDEPTPGDKWGYIKYGDVYGAKENGTSQYICQYSLQDCIDA